MQQLRFSAETIVWQEVPNEVSLAFLLSGCPLGCKGCHSSQAWQSENGNVLTEDYLQHRVAFYQGLISCVLFLGGEWQPKCLQKMLKLVRDAGLTTCLYTGLEMDELPNELFSNLTYVKTGRWIAERGGLNSLTTNQRFIDLRTGANLNHLFVKGH